MVPELIKISELATRAGVAKSTVQHYIREGLLPPPDKKPHRNMAYYRADLADRIRLIKELQEQQHLPLSTIKKLLKDRSGMAEIRSSLMQQPLALQAPEGKPVERAELLERAQLTEPQLDDIVATGLVQPQRRKSREYYEPADAAVVMAIGSMQAAGLNPENGFTLDDLSLYVDAMKQLVSREIKLFAKNAGNQAPDRMFQLARAGLEGTNYLLMAIRRKIFLDLIEGRQSRSGTKDSK